MHFYLSRLALYRVLLIFQYFCLAYFDAKIFGPCILLAGTLNYILFNKSIHSVRVLSWWLLFIFFVIVYLVNNEKLNVAFPLGTAVIFAVLLFFLIIPDSIEHRYFAITAFSFGIVLSYVPIILFVIVERGSFLDLYGRLHVITGEKSLLTSHLSIYLGFSAIALICQPYRLGAIYKFLTLAFGFLSLLCAVVLLGKFVFVSILIIFLFYQRSALRIVLLCAPILWFFYLSQETQLSSLYDKFLFRWTELFTNPSGRLALWMQGYDMLTSNIFGYGNILADFGYNSFHNIIFDSWRFGGLPLAFFVSLILGLEFYKSSQLICVSDPARRCLALLSVFTLLALQIEVYFEAMYKILFLLPCIFRMRVKFNSHLIKSNKGLEYVRK